MDEDEMRLREKLCKGVSTLQDDDEYRKIEKVLAPFLRTLRKRKHERADILPTANEELYLKRRPKDLLTRLETAFSDALEFKTLMNETAELLKVVTKSKSVNLYLTDYDAGTITLCPKYYGNNFRFQRKYEIDTGTYLAAHVAFTKDYVISSDILGDVRFPLGIPDVPAVKSAICMPIITNTKENCIGVIELYRECSEKPYDLINLQICSALTAWMGIAMEQNNLKTNLVKELEVHKEFSKVTDMYFGGVIPFNKVVADLIKVAKGTVNAEKGAFYVFIEPIPLNSEHVLLADAYEEAVDHNDGIFVYKKNARVSFAKNQPGVPGYAARTGTTVNVHDAYKDFRFDRRNDFAGFRTRCLAGFPVKNGNNVLAVLKLTNCLDHPYFRDEHVHLLESFLYQISQVCGYYFLSTEYYKMQLRMIMLEKLVDYHLRPFPDEINEVKLFILGEPQTPNGFMKFEWEMSFLEDEIVKYSTFIFLSPEILEPCFEVQNLVNFLLRVKKSYRPLLYHNFDHAFSVLHFAFNFALRTKDTYGAAEIVALLLAALCHDMDHTGLTNTFLSLQNDSIYKLYGDLCGELHRYDEVLLLIQQSDLLTYVSAQNYKLICGNLKRLMTALDMSVHLESRQKLMRLINTHTFNWDDPEHRILTQSMIIICCDYSFNFKSFDIAKKYTSTFYKELYQQGDLEKSMGFSPLPMLDRNKIDTYPENHVILLSIIVQPVVEIIVRLFPKLSILSDLLKNTLGKWNEMLEFRGREMWNIHEALVREKKEKRGSHRITLSSTLSSIRTVSSDIKSIKSN